MAWNQAGPARLRLSSQRLEIWPTRISILNNTPSEKDVQKHISDAVHIDAIAIPKWTFRGDRFEALEVDSNLLALLSRRYCWDVIPMISVDANLPFHSADIFRDGYKEWLQQVKEKQWTHVLIDLKHLDTDRLKKSEPILHQLKTDLHAINVCLLFNLAGNATIDEILIKPVDMRNCRHGWDTSQRLTAVE